MNSMVQIDLYHNCVAMTATVCLYNIHELVHIMVIEPITIGSADLEYALKSF